MTLEVYPAWTHETSRVISGPLNHGKFPGTRYPSWRIAKADVEKKFKVFVFWTLGNRWFARVKREM